ncbi:LCP family protein [Nocardia coubleae]|uniref:LCP family protein n=1 Tax=Nocardia coubleae TaxID=356147 RepID=A0A846W3H5_9NOCA|nr:LCP family protein [Nocardia coubleae]
MHRDGRDNQPLAYSQAPQPAQAPPAPRETKPRRREPVQHAPTQRPVPHHDAVPPRRRTPPPVVGGRAPRPPRPRRRRHPFRWFTVLIVALIVGMIAGVIYLDNSLTRIPALASYSDRVGDTPGTNWLLVGSDGRGDLSEDQEAELATGGDTGPERTDTIMLVHIPSSGPTTMVSLPRDSYVSIPGHGKDKLNASFALGGAPLLVQTVEVATGVRIDHYAQIGFGGFASVVDALGGIEMCLDQPIVDPLAGLDLPAGCQELSGPQALGFVRTRATPNADVDRMNHQRMFMSALLKKATSMGTLANPFALWPMATGVAGSLKVDDGDHIWNLAALGWAMRGDTVTTSVPIGGFTDTDVGNVLLWDKAKAPGFFDALAKDQQIPEDLITR